MVEGSLACGVSPRQDLRPHSWTYPPSTDDVFPDVLIFWYFAGGLSRPLVSLITTTKIQSLAQQVQRVNQQSRQQAGKQQRFKVESHPSLFQSGNQSQYTTQKKNRKVGAAKHVTPPHRLPPENVKTPKTLNTRSPPWKQKQQRK